MRDDLLVAAGVEVRAGLLGQRLGARRVAVGNRQESDAGMLGGQPRPQRADAPGADHGDADLVLLH